MNFRLCVEAGIRGNTLGRFGGIIWHARHPFGRRGLLFPDRLAAAVAAAVAAAGAAATTAAAAAATISTGAVLYEGFYFVFYAKRHQAVNFERPFTPRG